MLSDTDPKTERVWIDLWRRMTPEQRLQRALALTSAVIRRSKAAVAEANPELSLQDRNLLWAEIHYGRDLADRVRKHLAKHVAPQ